VASRGQEEGTGDEGVGTRVQMRKKLQSQIDAIEKLRKASSASQEFTTWRCETEEILKTLFGEESAAVEDFNVIYYTPIFLTCRMGDETFEEAYQNGLEEVRVFLLSRMEKIKRPG
jgi:hypothetical protein